MEAAVTMVMMMMMVVCTYEQAFPAQTHIHRLISQLLHTHNHGITVVGSPVL
jgi:hypothetical protein